MACCDTVPGNHYLCVSIKSDLSIVIDSCSTSIFQSFAIVKNKQARSEFYMHLAVKRPKLDVIVITCSNIFLILGLREYLFVAHMDDNTITWAVREHHNKYFIHDIVGYVT